VLTAGEQRDQILQILRLRWVRMVVRKCPVDGAEHLGDRAAQPPEHQRRVGAGDAVAAVHCDAQRPRQADVADDAVEVGGRDVGAWAFRAEAKLSASMRWRSLDVFRPTACRHPPPS
jgi:hypothetical protein